MSKIKKSVRVDMRKGFMLIRATNWQLPFLYQLGPIQKTKQIKTKKHSGTLFKHYFHENKSLAHPYILYKNKSLQYFLSYNMRQMTKFFACLVIF